MSKSQKVKIEDGEESRMGGFGGGWEKDGQ